MTFLRNLLENNPRTFGVLAKIMSNNAGLNRDSVDKKLMQLVAHNDDRDAFEELCRHYFNPLFNYLYRLTIGEGGGSSAEDIIQETYIVLWNLRKDYKPTARVKTFIFYIATIQHKRWVKSWLLKTLKNVQLNENIELSRSLTQFGKEEKEEIEEIETIEKIVLCIEALPEKFRVIFTKLYTFDRDARFLDFNEKNMRTLAENLDITYETFRKRKERGLKLLAENLKKIGIESRFVDSYSRRLINQNN